jgi:hypothetical protein
MPCVPPAAIHHKAGGNIAVHGIKEAHAIPGADSPGFGPLRQRPFLPGSPGGLSIDASRPACATRTRPPWWIDRMADLGKLLFSARHHGTYHALDVTDMPLPAVFDRSRNRRGPVSELIAIHSTRLARSLTRAISTANRRRG